MKVRGETWLITLITGILLCQIKCILFKRNLELKNRILVETYGDNAQETGFEASRIMILYLKIKNVVVYQKNVKTKNWRNYSMKTDLGR